MSKNRIEDMVCVPWQPLAALGMAYMFGIVHLCWDCALTLVIHEGCVQCLALCHPAASVIRVWGY